MNPLADALVAPLSGRADAVLIRPDGSTLSGDALYRLSGQIANVLVGAGLQPGDRVAIQAEKSVEALALYLACLRAGALFLPLNTAYTTAELDYFLGDAEPRVAICDPASEAALGPMARDKGIELLTLDGAGGGTLAEGAATAPDEFATVPREPDDLAAILYTSGTTGRSKGAMLSQDNLLSNTEALVETWRFTSDDVLLHALPIFHAHGLFVAVNVLLRVGGRMIFLPKFDLETVIARLPEATAMMGVPTFYTRLLSDARFDRDLTSHMRLFISGSAPLLAETHQAFEARTGHRILERYGMTETTMSTSNPYDGERRAGTVGFPLPRVEARITDAETGAVLEQGEVGILEVRGPNVFKGYWRMPEKTAEEFRADGFFITGDIARIDAEGYVTIVGRAKDLVISGGYNVYPKEVESEIDALDGVLESAVIGVPHPDFGEAVVAAVVREGGSQIVAEGIQTALQERLAKYKLPKLVYFVEELPRNTMGKVQKNILRDEYQGVFNK
ncbi:MAG: malonyl-CoA synthase [Litoreibacter sp.]|nr:malonyl-CoA synthase [Boseongicola sp.]NNK79212.1 malonyl-CoA synthase [Litoreibacter sp.]